MNCQILGMLHENNSAQPLQDMLCMATRGIRATAATVTMAILLLSFFFFFLLKNKNEDAVFVLFSFFSLYVQRLIVS